MRYFGGGRRTTIIINQPAAFPVFLRGMMAGDKGGAVGRSMIGNALFKYRHPEGIGGNPEALLNTGVEAMVSVGRFNGGGAVAQQFRVLAGVEKMYPTLLMTWNWSAPPPPGYRVGFYAEPPPSGPLAPNVAGAVIVPDTATYSELDPAYGFDSVVEKKPVPAMHQPVDCWGCRPPSGPTGPSFDFALWAKCWFFEQEPI